MLLPQGFEKLLEMCIEKPQPKRNIKKEHMWGAGVWCVFLNYKGALGNVELHYILEDLFWKEGILGMKFSLQFPLTHLLI